MVSFVKSDKSLVEFIKTTPDLYKGLNSFVYRAKNREGYIIRNDTEACFYNILIPYFEVNESRGEIIEELRFLVKNRITPETKKYFQWVMNKSPWKDAFITKGRSLKWIEEGIIMDVSKPSIYVVNAMSAMRHAWEFPKFLDSFYEFQKMGFSPEFSFILSNFMLPDGKTYCPNSTHATFEQTEMKVGAISNFKKGIMPLAENRPPMNEKYHCYRGIFKLFNDPKEKGSLYTNALSKIKQDQIGSGWNVRYVFDLKNEEIFKAFKELDK